MSAFMVVTPAPYGALFLPASEVQAVTVTIGGNVRSFNRVGKRGLRLYKGQRGYTVTNGTDKALHVPVSAFNIVTVTLTDGTTLVV